jgi:hypothetical protein
MHPEEDTAANDQLELPGDHENMIQRLLFSRFALFCTISAFCLGRKTPLIGISKDVGNVDVL